MYLGIEMNISRVDIEVYIGRICYSVREIQCDYVNKKGSLKFVTFSGTELESINII